MHGNAINPSLAWLRRPHPRTRRKLGLSLLFALSSPIIFNRELGPNFSSFCSDENGSADLAFGIRPNIPHNYPVTSADLTAYPGESAAQRSQRLQSVMCIDRILSSPHQDIVMNQHSTMDSRKAGCSLIGVGTQFSPTLSIAYPQQVDESSMEKK